MNRLTRAILVLLVTSLMVACSGGSIAPSTTTSEAPLASASALASAHPSFGPAPTATPGQARLQPSSGAYFGLNLDWGNETVAQASESLGHTPAVWVQFTNFPLDDGGRANVEAFIEQVAAVGGMGLLTLEPHEGLGTVTDEAAAHLGDLLARAWTDHGVPMFVRFAHEMNGSWYPWSQQPDAYVKAFQRVAAAVHERSPSSAMIWAPNEGSGYPFIGHQFAAAAGSKDATALDTNRDGTVDAKDDPYGPYYPGDDAVDWIGVSLYHWGLAYPWGENELPRPGTFEKLIRGVDPGAHGGGSTIPDMYATYAEGHDKPLAIIETAILYDPSATSGPSEKDLKSAWFDQVFSDTTRTDFPRIGMLNWFEWRKQESEVGRVIDWRLASDPALARSLLDSAPARWLHFAGE